MELRKAERKQAKIKMGLQGPSGSGKTMSSLLIAFGMVGDWTKIGVIDTENNSSDLYAHLGDYKVLPLSKPYSPERYIQAIDVCIKSNLEVIIIDSISHEWEGSGGILDIHGSMLGNSFTNWAKITPRHNEFVQKILQSPCHVIATIRSKQDYVLSEKNGKMVAEKVGLKGVTREGLDYEFTLVFDINIKHQVSASKDRTGMFMDKPSFTISEKTGDRIRKWCESGKSLHDVIQMIDQAATVEQLRSILLRYQNFRKEIEPLTIEKKIQLENPVVETIKNLNH
ncbi:AAA family ATPase [uncultured Sunxiuqinia sp.]|uniref:AAA family ATPase n=1 Tax=uncultured Sunxiuqinia sp. TaxID=1573825 RepID=UPI002AA6C399|nr:AAA family ATPase [uncultured Sunxiuqinia sp.]